MIHRIYLSAKNSHGDQYQSQHSHIDIDNNFRRYIIECNYMCECRVGYRHVSIELCFFGLDDNCGFLGCGGLNWVEWYDAFDWILVKFIGLCACV